MGVAIANAIGISFGSGGVDWASYWAGLTSDMAFKSGEFDHDNALWLDESGNGNDMSILCPYYVADSAWQFELTNYITDWGFSTYHEFVYTADNYTLLFSLCAASYTLKFLYVGTGNDKKLRIFNRISNSTYSGSTILTVGQKYKLLVNWIDKDNWDVYLDGSLTPEISVNGQNQAWYAEWNRINLNGYRNGGTLVPSYAGAIIETRIISGTATWTTIGDNVTAWYYHQGNSIREWDYSGNERHMTPIGTLPTTRVYYNGVSPHLKNGYQVCKRISYGGVNYNDILLPFDNNGDSLVNEIQAPFRDENLPTYSEEYKPVVSVDAATNTYNGCDIKFSFPYNAMLAESDVILGALFTGTTPNQLDPYSLWDDHYEKHVMFLNRGYVDKISTGWQRWQNRTCDGNNLSISDFVVFKAVRDDYVNILKNQYGYSVTPSVITGSTYLMASANDSFKLESTHVLAAKLAGLHGLFYESDNTDIPLKCRYADVEKINGRNIFSNGSDTIWIYKKPLLPSHFETALSTHLGLTDIENIITTADGVNYYDIDYERYVVTKDGTINLNPNATVNAKYDIFDRRNVVGSAKEIWHADMVLGAAFWTWNLQLGTKKLYQPSVSKYIQAAYSGKLFIRQDWNYKNNIICPYIISFATPLAGAAKTAMFAFIDFPETVNEPAIVGDGITDDALAINTAMGSNAAIMLYEKTALIQTSVAIPDDVELILADSIIGLNDAINLNVIKNADLTSGENVRLSGYGISVIDGNGDGQDREAYTHDHDYRFIGILFGTVDNLKVKGFEIKDTALWGLNCQMCANSLLEHIRINQLGSYANQDGVDVGFGTQNTIIRYITGFTNDDFSALLNYDNSIELNLNIVVNGTRTTQYNYYRDLRSNGRISAGSSGAQLIRIYDNQNYGIKNIEWQNCYGYENVNAGYDPWLSLIIFSDHDLTNRSTEGVNKEYVFNNIRGSSTRNVRFYTGNYSEIQIANLILDDKNESCTYHIWVQNHALTNILINSILYFAPGTIYEESGGIITNLIHNEVINY